MALNRIRDAINKEIMGGKDYHINWLRMCITIC